ncbi:GT4 family glycosyltransferase PelF [Pelotalea chapellei]|uniref:GT4 family glycosyltransferase PelF n=1 Tax=Pelotalea chapellei TaxID=44671 RepID=A0ABS5U854_9BACT|nr:GT4 family glycosyltransferase PelF [Pelotalea chapellei]MBT1071853.1 GT4 family glycosyltransferase PelF [Pelotalea chapellei]
MNAFPKADHVDIMLLLEGTFPYVSGGVSTWVHQIISGFPQYTFGAVFIGSRRGDYAEIKYELPSNLIHLETCYLYDFADAPLIEELAGSRTPFDTIRHMHAMFHKRDLTELENSLKVPDFFLDPVSGVDFQNFLHSHRSWELISQLYQQRCKDPSFVDYFWTVRNMHAPIWLLAKTANTLIPARLYHTVSTGYAGFLGTLLHHSSGRPLLLSEHGIYTKERRIDIFNSDWIQDNRNALQRDPTEVSYYRDLWIRFFETLGRFCYGASSTIVSLYEGARNRQLDDGALPERTTIIPNGIDIDRYAPLREVVHETPPLVLTLLGRVVPIKDIKTFIRGLRLIANQLPFVQGWIIGPEDEDPEYAAECKALVESLDIADQVRFMGFKDPLDIFPGTGLVVLSSVSEGLPLVVLEAFAAGIPVVATDVGACRQLILGSGAEDEAIGSAGGIVGINNPLALAAESLRLLQDPQQWKQARQAGIDRVERFYKHRQMFDKYHELYHMGLV